MLKPGVALLVLVIVAGACTTENADDDQPTTTGGPTTTTTTTDAGILPPEQGVPFGSLTAVDLPSTSPAYGGPSHPDSLDGVIVAGPIAQVLATNDARATLTRNGFVVIPGTTRQFHHVYEAAAYDGYPVFMTTDAAYHVWHLAFDKLLRETEQQVLLPQLESMLLRLVELSRAQRDELAGTALAGPADRVAQFYEAAATLLELDIGPIGALAEAEVRLALEAGSIEVSPTIGVEVESDFVTVKTDYSLFAPRGHYTRNAELERYFRAMSQLGNNAFLLEPSALQLAVLATRVLLADPAVVEQWRTIYEPTAFLVGAADDYTPLELAAAIGSCRPSGWDDLLTLTGPDSLQGIADDLRAGRPVAINPEAASVRVMGARFVIDSFILDQLVIPNVAERNMATPLDVAAAFGSDWALDELIATGATEYPGYSEQLGKLQGLVADRTIDDWGRTVYDAWLYAVEPMWQPHGPAFPDFMQTPAWNAKAHQTGFGSYTELKHDTILYSKQAVAEGGGEEPSVPPRHWVEPDPVVFGRLAAVTALTAHRPSESRSAPA